jgi:toxin FitB
MFLLDTNVISELMKPEPSLTVMHWIEQQTSDSIYISTITIAEIDYGLGVLPDAHRRKGLEKAFKQTIIDAFENHRAC